MMMNSQSIHATGSVRLEICISATSRRAIGVMGAQNSYPPVPESQVDATMHIPKRRMQLLAVIDRRRRAVIDTRQELF